MLKKLLLGVSFALVPVLIYLAFWPVAIDPVSWQAPPNPGYLVAPGLGRLSKEAKL